jgi:lysine 6-dehydrogenase
MKLVVLGGYGIIGEHVVRDIFTHCKDCEIIIAGRNLAKAKLLASSFKSNRVSAKEIDIKNQYELVKLLKNSDVCVNCVQYYFNYDIMLSCLKAKTNYIDLGGMFHMTKKQLSLKDKFKKAEKTAILGLGAAPGLTNLLTAYASSDLKKVVSVDMLFADVDYTKYAQPFVLPYSFKTLIEEYTENPIILRNGKFVKMPPRSGEKVYDFKNEFGKQTGFLTLHSEAATLSSFLKNKGVKNIEFRVTFPKEFSEQVEIIIENGFASKDEIKIHKNDLQIREITSTIMDRWLPKKGTKIKDKELIRSIINSKITMDAITESDGKISGGTLNTAIPCAIGAIILAKKEIARKGVFAPEAVIDPNKFFKELRKRKISVLKNGRRIN